MPNPRWWLVAAYTLAAVLVQGAHDHGSVDATETKHEAGCEDLRLHISGHGSTDLSQHQVDCFACQHRDKPQVHQTAAHVPFRPNTAFAVDRAWAFPHTEPFGLFCSRAPPHV